MPWSPDQLANLGMRLLAADIAGADASAITTWTDRVAASAFTQATAGKKPLYYSTTSAHLINGQPCVHFDGVDDLLRFAGTLTTALSGHVFVVMRPHSVAGASLDFLASADEATVNFFFICGISSGTLLTTNRNNDTQDTVFSPVVLVADELYLFEIASTGLVYTLSINGVPQAKTVSSGADNGDWFGDITARDNMVVGALKRSTEAGWFNGDIAEIILLNAAISAADRIELNNYITDTYGLLPRKGVQPVSARGEGVRAVHRATRW